MINNLKGTNSMDDLTNLELLVLTRCIGGLNSSEFQKGVNNNFRATKVPFALLESSDVNQNLYTKLKTAAENRGIDLDTGVAEVIITTTEHLI